MSILERAAPLPDAVVRYDERADAVVDVYLPEAEARDLVVFLHGGFWREAYDRIHARPLAKALADEGYAVALPEYRRVGAGGGWPTTCHDVRRALGQLPRLLDAIGVHPTSTVLTGHSAGGHLSLWLAAHDAAVDRVVPLAPVGDLRAAAAIGMGNGAVPTFLGSDRPVDDADPAVLLGRRRPAYPIRIVHGTADDTVGVENSRGLVAQHPWIGLTELDGIAHYDLIDPETDAYPRLLAALRA